MADEDSTPSNQIIIDRERELIALHACWEIDSIAMLFEGMLAEEDEIRFLAFRGLAGRLRQLNNVLLGAIGDPYEGNAALLKTLGHTVMVGANHAENGDRHG